MNSAQQSRRSNHMFFFSAVGLTAVLLVVSGFFVSSLLTSSVSGVESAEKACLATMRVNGFNPDTSKESEIKVVRRNISSIESLVFQTGVIIASCPTYTLTDYCAGAGCQNPGVSFTLNNK